MHKSLLCAYNRANNGPSKAYKLFKEQFGDYENVGYIQRDLQNYSRDLKTLIRDSDHTSAKKGFYDRLLTTVLKELS